MTNHNRAAILKAYLTEGSARVTRSNSIRNEEIQYVLQTFLTAGDEARADGDTLRAERFYHETIKLAAKEFDESVPEIALAKFHLSMLYLDRGTLAMADVFARSALKIFIEVFGEGHPATGMAMHQLAEVHIAQSKCTAAIPLKEQASKILAAHCGGRQIDPLEDTLPLEPTKCVKTNLDEKAFEGGKQLAIHTNN